MALAWASSRCACAVIPKAVFKQTIVAKCIAVMVSRRAAQQALEQSKHSFVVFPVVSQLQSSLMPHQGGPTSLVLALPRGGSWQGLHKAVSAA